MSAENRKTILLVEDEAISARLNKRILEKYGYDVIHANSGEKALVFIKVNPRFDLILVDIDLGKGIDGIETAEKILKDHNLPVVFLSAHTEPAVVEKTEGITSYGYVIKNSGEAVLIASIKMAMKLYEAKEDLKTAEEKYRNLFINSQVGIFRTDIDTGLVLEANDRFAKLLGFKDRGELFSEPVHISDWYADPEARSRMISMMRENGEVIDYEEKFKRKDGSDLWIRYSARIVHDKGWIEGVNEDITDFKKAESEKNLIYKELFASEKKYRLIFDNSPLGLIYFNKDGIITDCNDAFVKIVGTPWSELVGLNILKFLDPGIVSEFKKVLNGNPGYYEGDYRSITSGKIIPVRVVFESIQNVDKYVTGGVAIVEDITDKRIAERAMLDEIEKERARIGHILHDSLGQKLGAVLYLAQAFEKKYKKTGELSDNDLYQLVELTSSALDETRSLSRGLDLSVIEVEGFLASLNDIVLRTSSVYGIEIELDVSDSLNNYGSQKLMNLYYIILESVNNAVRHGDAEKIRLLYYAKDGRGYFTVASEQKNIYKVENPGMGLRIMKYRAEISGMEINIVSDDKRVEVNISMGDIPEKF